MTAEEIMAEIEKLRFKYDELIEATPTRDIHSDRRIAAAIIGKYRIFSDELTAIVRKHEAKPL